MRFFTEREKLSAQNFVEGVEHRLHRLHSLDSLHGELDDSINGPDLGGHLRLGDRRQHFMRGWRQVFNQDVPAVPLSWLGHVLPVFEDGDLERPRRQLDDDMRRWVIVRLACRRRVERPETGLDQSCCLRYTVNVLSSLGCCEQWLEDSVIDTGTEASIVVLLFTYGHREVKEPEGQ